MKKLINLDWRNMRFLSTILFLLSFCLFPTLNLFAAESMHGVFMVIKGDVTAKSPNKEKQKVKVGDKVFPGDTVETATESRAKIVMSDRNVINISPETQLVIQKYENNGDEKNVEMNLLQGKVRNNVEQKYDGDKNKFMVKTPTAVAGVRGTQFFTSFDPGTQITSVVTLRGTVSLAPVNVSGGSAKPVLVKKGESTSVSPGANPEPPKAVPKEDLKKLDQETTVSAAPSKQDAPAKETAKSDKKEEKKSEEKSADAGNANNAPAPADSSSGKSADAKDSGNKDSSSKESGSKDNGGNKETASKDNGPGKETASKDGGSNAKDSANNKPDQPKESGGQGQNNTAKSQPGPTDTAANNPGPNAPPPPGGGNGPAPAGDVGGSGPRGPAAIDPAAGGASANAPAPGSNSSGGSSGQTQANNPPPAANAPTASAPAASAPAPLAPPPMAPLSTAPTLPKMVEVGDVDIGQFKNIAPPAAVVNAPKPPPPVLVNNPVATTPPPTTVVNDIIRGTNGKARIIVVPVPRN